MHPGLGPRERLGVDIIGSDEGVDMRHQSLAAVERGARERLGRQDREPDFHLIKPGGVFPAAGSDELSTKSAIVASSSPRAEPASTDDASALGYLSPEMSFWE